MNQIQRTVPGVEIAVHDTKIPRTLRRYVWYSSPAHELTAEYCSIRSARLRSKYDSLVPHVSSRETRRGRRATRSTAMYVENKGSVPAPRRYVCPLRSDKS